MRSSTSRISKEKEMRPMLEAKKRFSSQLTHQIK